MQFVRMHNKDLMKWCHYFLDMKQLIWQNVLTTSRSCSHQWHCIFKSHKHINKQVIIDKNRLFACLVRTEKHEHPILIQVLPWVAAPASVKPSEQKQPLLPKTEHFLYVFQGGVVTFKWLEECGTSVLWKCPELLKATGINGGSFEFANKLRSKTEKIEAW